MCSGTGQELEKKYAISQLGVADKVLVDFVSDSSSHIYSNHSSIPFFLLYFFFLFVPNGTSKSLGSSSKYRN